jgi:hypothetical protein
MSAAGATVETSTAQALRPERLLPAEFWIYTYKVGGVWRAADGCGRSESYSCVGRGESLCARCRAAAGSVRHCSHSGVEQHVGAWDRDRARARGAAAGGAAGQTRGQAARAKGLGAPSAGIELA